MVTAWYNNVGGIRDLLKQVCHLSFAEKNPRDIIILTETHINHEQIHHQIHIRNNWLGPIVFSPGDSHTKGLLVLLHPVIKGITEVDTELIQKGGLCPLRLLLSPEFSTLMPMQGIVIGNSWLGGVSLKDCKIIWKIKMR